MEERRKKELDILPSCLLLCDVATRLYQEIDTGRETCYGPARLSLAPCVDNMTSADASPLYWSIWRQLTGSSRAATVCHVTVDAFATVGFFLKVSRKNTGYLPVACSWHGCFLLWLHFNPSVTVGETLKVKAKEILGIADQEISRES